MKVLEKLEMLRTGWRMAPPKFFLVHEMVHGGGGEKVREITTQSSNLCVLNSNNALFFLFLMLKAAHS